MNIEKVVKANLLRHRKPKRRTSRYGKYVRLSDVGRVQITLNEEFTPSIEVANQAIQVAYKTAKDQGLSVVLVKDDQIVEQHSDGTATILEILSPKIKVTSLSLSLK